MKYDFLLNKTSEKKADHLQKNLTVTESGNKNTWLSNLKKGQQITGTVISVNKEVTLDFQGQRVAAPNEVLKEAIPGEMKTFEVVKASDKGIELKLLDGLAGKHHTFTVNTVKESDWGMIKAQKDQTAKKAGKDARSKEQANKLNEIGSKLTEQDYGNLEKEGFNPADFTIDGLYEAMNRMKSKASKEDQSQASTEPVKTNSYDKAGIAEGLKAENIPATEDNINQVSAALGLSEAAGKLDDKAMQYLISKDASPTIENIYKAYYSGKDQNQPLSEQDWQALQGQAIAVIQAAGYEVNAENLQTARWLIESNLPLTPETFAYKKELDGIKKDFNQGEVFNRILDGMGKGVNPKDISLINSKEADIKKVIEDISSIGPEAVSQAVRSDTELTVRNLASIQKDLRKNGSTEEQAEEVPSDQTTEQELDAEEAEYRYKEIKAQRQLEEIRLKMTYEAAGTLEQKGFKIDTQELSKVVDALKQLEDDYYKKYFKEADAQVTQESLNTLKETTQSLAQLKYIPSLVLGSTLQDWKAQTIPSLLSEGSKLQAQLDKAGTAYDTLMTVPNKEYGDSINKAFANMDSLLSELKIDNTEQNQRAVRALSYNRMDINQENIQQVKAYDLQVTSLITNLHPAVTVRMIKDGINPLKMPITDLNKTIDRIKQEQGITSEDKFSSYLHKLDKENGISEQDRKAYIGIYRLLYNVDKSDGAALGSVIKAGQEVTLSNLLTAVQTGKKGGLDTVINDEFGTLQSITRGKESIAEQLSSFNGESGQQNQEQAAKDNSYTDQTEYLGQILKQIKDEISPENLIETEKSILQTGSVIPQEGITQKRGVWETIKDIPVEKLQEKINTAATEQPSDGEEYAAKTQEIRDLCKDAEQSIRFLGDYRVPSTPMNIMIANHILSNGESPIRKLLKLQKDNLVEKSADSLKELPELSDKLIDKQSMQDVYDTLETNASDALSQACSGEKIDSFKLAELKSLGQQLKFSKTLAEKEFYQIPVEAGSGITNINLTIIRGSKDAGRLSVSLQSEKLGNVKAEFTLKGKDLKGFIGSDSQSGLEELQSNSEDIEAAAQENEVNLKQMDFGTLRIDNNTYNYQNPDPEEGASSGNQNTERTLYRLAKAFIRTVRTAENSGSESTLAVS